MARRKYIEGHDAPTRRKGSAVTFPTHIDLEFYESKRPLPAWAQKLATKQQDSRWSHSAMIDEVVNVHAGQRLTAGEASALSLLMIVAGWRRRGVNLERKLLAVAAEPGCLINPEKRAALASRLAQRLLGAAAVPRRQLAKHAPWDAKKNAR